MRSAVLLSLLILNSKALAVVITGFGTGDFTPTTSDFFAIPTATSYQILGTDFGSSFTGNVGLTNLGASAYTLQLTGNFSGTATSNFQIRLFDNTVSQNLAVFQGNFSNFTPQNTFKTLTLSPLSQAAGFNNQVAKIQFVTSGTGDSVNLTLDTLSTTAVPEPSSLVFFGVTASLGIGLAVRGKIKLSRQRS